MASCSRDERKFADFFNAARTCSVMSDAEQNASAERGKEFVESLPFYADLIKELKTLGTKLKVAIAPKEKMDGGRRTKKKGGQRRKRRVQRGGVRLMLRKVCAGIIAFAIIALLMAGVYNKQGYIVDTLNYLLSWTGAETGLRKIIQMFTPCGSIEQVATPTAAGGLVGGAISLVCYSANFAGPYAGLASGACWALAGSLGSGTTAVTTAHMDCAARNHRYWIFLYGLLGTIGAWFAGSNILRGLGIITLRDPLTITIQNVKKFYLFIYNYIVYAEHSWNPTSIRKIFQGVKTLTDVEIEELRNDFDQIESMKQIILMCKQVNDATEFMRNNLNKSNRVPDSSEMKETPGQQFIRPRKHLPKLRSDDPHIHGKIEERINELEGAGGYWTQFLQYRESTNANDAAAKQDAIEASRKVFSMLGTQTMDGIKDRDNNIRQAFSSAVDNIGQAVGLDTFQQILQQQTRDENHKRLARMYIEHQRVNDPAFDPNNIRIPPIDQLENWATQRANANQALQSISKTAGGGKRTRRRSRKRRKRSRKQKRSKTRSRSRKRRRRSRKR